MIQCGFNLLFIFNGMVSVIYILIEVSLLASILDTLIIIHDEINISLAKMSKFGGVNGNGSNVIMILSNISETSRDGLGMGYVFNSLLFFYAS